MHRIQPEIPRTSAAGFTLAELLLVLFLLGIILGIGGMYVQRADPGSRGLQDSAVTFVGSSRDRARASKHPVMLEVIPPSEDGKVGALLSRWVFRRMMEAGFEPAYESRQGLVLAPPANLEAVGRFGAALDLRQGGGCEVTGRSGGNRLQPQNGVEIEFQIYTRSLQAAQIMNWPDFLSLRSQKDGRLQLTAHVATGQERDRLERVTLMAPPGTLQAERWQHLRIRLTPGQPDAMAAQLAQTSESQGTNTEEANSAAAGGTATVDPFAEMLIEIEGRVAVREPFHGRLANPTEAPYLGDPEGKFQGLLDEWVVWVRVRERGPEMPNETVVDLKGPHIVFDRFGMLDTTFHPEDIAVEIYRLDEKVAGFTVGRFSEQFLDLEADL